jgi:hypothetical protein
MDERLRLRAQIRVDALRPLDDGEGLPRSTDSGDDPWPPETIDEAAQFLHLNVSPPFTVFSFPLPESTDDI